MPMASIPSQRSMPTDGFRLKYRHVSLSGFSGWARGPAVRALARHPEVVSIHADGEMHATLAQGVPPTVLRT